MNAIEPVEIILDKPRKLKPNHRGLRIAEAAFNKLNGVSGYTSCGIDFALVLAYNTEIYTRNLQCALLLGFLSTDNPDLTIEDVDNILDHTALPFAEINDKLWEAYKRVAGSSLTFGKGAAEKKTTNPDPPTGSSSGPSGDSILQ